MQLSKHFTRAEFEASPTAEARGWSNLMSGEQISNAQALCRVVLEPLREWCQEPVIITSGFRCSKLNVAVGGVPGSQHMKGQAVDIKCSRFAPDGRERSKVERVKVLASWYTWLQENCVFDQLIWEVRPTTRWIHVSYKPIILENRNQSFKNVK